MQGTRRALRLHPFFIAELQTELEPLHGCAVHPRFLATVVPPPLAAPAEALRNAVGQLSYSKHWTLPLPPSSAN